MSSDKEKIKTELRAARTLSDGRMFPENSILPGAPSSPLHRIENGNVAVTIWCDKGKEKDRSAYILTIDHHYDDPDGMHAVDNNFAMQDLPALREAAKEAYQWVEHYIKDPEKTMAKSNQQWQSKIQSGTEPRQKGQ